MYAVDACNDDSHTPTCARCNAKVGCGWCGSLGTCLSGTGSDEASGYCSAVNGTGDHVPCAEPSACDWQWGACDVNFTTPSPTGYPVSSTQAPVPAGAVTFVASVDRYTFAPTAFAGAAVRYVESFLPAAAAELPNNTDVRLSVFASVHTDESTAGPARHQSQEAHVAALAEAVSGIDVGFYLEGPGDDAIEGFFDNCSSNATLLVHFQAFLARETGVELFSMRQGAPPTRAPYTPTPSTPRPWNPPPAPAKKKTWQKVVIIVVTVVVVLVVLVAGVTVLRQKKRSDDEKQRLLGQQAPESPVEY
jgi:hypothetical protein